MKSFMKTSNQTNRSLSWSIKLRRSNRAKSKEKQVRNMTCKPMNKGLISCMTYYTSNGARLRWQRATKPTSTPSKTFRPCMSSKSASPTSIDECTKILTIRCLRSLFRTQMQIYKESYLNLPDKIIKTAAIRAPLKSAMSTFTMIRLAVIKQKWNFLA